MSAWKLKLLVDYIEAHLGDKITARDLASRIDVGVGQLFRGFKASVGVSPLRYVATRRVELVCTMLITTREPICQVALVCGFSEQAHLCKVFRRMIGMSPSSWRRSLPARGTEKFKIIDVTAFAPTHQRQNIYAVGNKFL